MSRLFTYSIQGATLRLRVDEATLLPQAECLHSCSCRSQQECDDTADADLIWAKEKSGELQLTITNESGPDPVSEAILFFLSEHRLTQLFAERLRHLLQIHAATVVDPLGNAWLVSGPSRAGKTSLTLAFILSGWHWLSDEYALFEEGRPETVLGFPRNFNLKETSFPIFPETAGKPHSIEYFSTGRGVKVRFLDPLDLSRDSWRPEAKLKGLILPQWTPGLPHSTVRKIDGVAVAQTLLGEIANWTPWALEFITQICRELPVFEYRYTNPRDITELQATMKQCSA